MNDGTARIAPALEGNFRCEHTLRGHTANVTALAVGKSASSSSTSSSKEFEAPLVATGSKDKTIRVWSSGSGKCLTGDVGVQGHAAAVTCLAFPPGKKFNRDFLLSGSADKTLKVWKIEKDGKGKDAITTLRNL